MPILDEGTRLEFLIVAHNQKIAHRLAELLQRMPAPRSLGPIVSIAPLATGEPMIGNADVVFVNVDRPHGPWRETIRRLTAESQCTPIIAVLPHADDALCAEAMADGASSCLALEPHDADRFCATVDCAVALRRTAREHEATESSLRAEIDRFRSVFEAAPVVLLTTDRELRCTWVGATRVHFGTDVLGKRLSELSCDDIVENLEDLMIDVLTTGVDARRDVHLVLSGEECDLDASVAAIRDPTGNIVGVAVTSLDATRRKAAECAAQRQSTLFDAIERAGRMGTWSWDITADRIEWSDGLYRVLGVQRGEVLPSMAEFLALVHPDDRNRVIRTHDALLHERGDKSVQLKVRLMDGASTHRMLQASVNVESYTESGTAAFLVGALQDVTEHEVTDDALRASEQLFRNVMTHSAIGIAVVSLDGRWLKMNRALCDMLGYSEEELLERTCAGITHPGDVEEDVAQLHRLFANEISSYQLEKRYLHKSGHSVWVLLTRSAVHDPQGRPIYAVSQAQDITERKRSQEASEFITEASQVLASSLESGEILRTIAHLAVPRLSDWCTIDLIDSQTGKVREVEAVAVSAEREEILRNIRSRFPLAPFAFDHPVSRVIRTGQASLVTNVQGEAMLRFVRDPEHLQMLRRLATTSWMIVPLAARGRIIGAITFGAVESGRHYTAEDLRVAEELATSAALAIDNARLYDDATGATKLRDDVLGFVTHDLRNPLAAIVRWSTELDDASVTSEERYRGTAAIREAADVMNKLINDLMDLTRLESGHLPVDPEPVRPDYLLSTVRDMFEPSARAKSIEFHVELSDLPRVHADPQRIHQVLSNLVGNSMRFVPVGGTITLRAQARDDDVQFSVSDTGPGISREDLPRVFDHFWQAAHARKTGAGLGLAIARGIVEAHKGRIWVDSEPGRGSTFFFTLPTWRGAIPDHPEAEMVLRPATTATEVLRVLVVEDHPLTRSGLVQLLKRQTGIEVVGQAATGEEGLELVPKLHPDVVIMDLSMPGMGGVEATRRIVAQSAEAIILVLTADDAPATLAEALRAGARGYLKKTVTEDELITSLRAVARGELLIDPSLKEYLRAGLRPPMDEETIAGLQALSERERKVLTLAARGYTAVQAGEKLFLSPKTVETYRSRAMRKLGLTSRAELVAFAMRIGLLSS
jgi:PAS domain S-box-containing protein